MKFQYYRDWDVVQWWYIVLWCLTHPLIFAVFIAFLVQQESFISFFCSLGFWGLLICKIGFLLRWVIENFHDALAVLYIGGLAFYVSIKEKYKTLHHLNQTKPKKGAGIILRYTGLWFA